MIQPTPGTPAQNSVHMRAMSIDQILKSIGEDQADLNSQVAQHRQMSAACEMVLADHWDVEEYASSIENLASRLQTIRDLVAGHLGHPSPIGELADAIEEIALPTSGSASEVLRTHLGLTEPTPEGNRLLLSDKAIYGHPGLRFATHAELNQSYRSMVYNSYIVNPATGAVGPIQDEETAEAAIQRLGREFLHRH